MKKRLMAVLVCLVGVLLIAGAASAKTTIRFWAEWAEHEVLPIIEGFEAANPDYTVEYTQFKWGEMMPRLLTAQAAGTPPDVLIQDRFRVGGWAARNGAMALDALIEADPEISPEQFYPATWYEANWQGKQYAIPWQTDVRAVYWNKDIFAEVGLDPNLEPDTSNWETMADLAVKLTEIDSAGNVVRIGFIPSQGSWGNGGDYVYVWANGGDFMSEDGRTVTLTDPKIVETLEWMSDIANRCGGIEKLAAFGATFLEGAQKPFLTGQIAMQVTGDWEYRDILKYNPSMNFGIGSWKIRGTDTPITFSGGFALAIPAGVKDTDGAWKLIKYMAGLEGQVKLIESTGTIPALRAAANDEAITRDPWKKFLVDLTEYTRYRPVSPVAQLIQDMWVGTARDEALYGKKTPLKALEDANRTIQRQLDEFWAKQN